MLSSPLQLSEALQVSPEAIHGGMQAGALDGKGIKQLFAQLRLRGRNTPQDSRRTLS